MALSQEMLKKLKDPKWYLENCTKIKGKIPGALIPFKLNEAQKDLFNTLRTNNRIIILKARQIGYSTAVVGYYYHNTIMNPGTTTAIIGYNADLTAELLDKVKIFYKTTPKELQPTIHYNSKHEISFPAIDSKIIVLPSNETVGRGYTLHNVLATEFSAWDNADEKITTLEASVPIGGKMVIESTPRGQGNAYHRMWMAEDNGYVKKEYGWWWGYSQTEIEIIRRRMNNPMTFAQEFGCEFLASGRSVFDQQIVKKQRANVRQLGEKMPIGKDGVEETVEEWERLRIYRHPRPGKVYVLGGDVAEGVQGGDYSSAVIFDRETGEEVAFFRGYVPPDRFGDWIDKWGRLFNNALVVIEINNHGLTTVTRLKQLVYPTMYYRPSKFETTAIAQSDRMGWKTNRMTKPLMIDGLAQAIRDSEVMIHSKEFLDEMTVFVYDDDGNMNAQYGFHDDTIMAGAIALQGFKIIYHGELKQLEYEEHLPVSFAY